MKHDAKKKARSIPKVREESSTYGRAVRMKRLTIDVPAKLHANVKAGCARRGIKMADAIRELLEENFRETR